MKRRVILILLTIITCLLMVTESGADGMPAQPYNLTASNLTDTSAYLTWETATPHNSDRWLIYKKQTNGSWYQGGTSHTKSYTVSVNDLTNSYQFKVVGEAGSPAWSGTQSQPSNIVTVPAKPTSFTASNLTATSAYLTWETSSPHGADRWLIYKRQTNGSWVQAGTAHAKNYTVSVNDMNNSYQFRVYGENGSTAWSGTKSLPSVIITVPARPSGLTVSNVLDTSAKLTWTTSSPHGADRWLIYKKAAGGSWTQAGTSSSKSFTVTGLTPNTSYQFKVYGESGATAWSGIKSRVSSTVSCTTTDDLSASALQAAFNALPDWGDWDSYYGLQCVDLPQWFMDEYTSLTSISCNGCDMVSYVANANGLTVTHTPTPFSIFSVAGGKKFFGCSGDSAGHTGIVLSVNTSANPVEVTVLQTSHSFEADKKRPNSWTETYQLTTAATPWVTFVDISSFLN